MTVGTVGASACAAGVRPTMTKSDVSESKTFFIFYPNLSARTPIQAYM
jgi:hypothetical protein